MTQATTRATPASNGKMMMWGGIALSAIPALMLVASAVAKLTHAAPVREGFAKFGYPESILTPLGVVELICAVLFAIPQTAVLGAILMTGYLGGAVATHVRIGDPFIPPLALGIIAWAGLYLRDERIRALLPLRRP